MTMGEAIRSVLSHYASFDGRATRSEFWWWVLFTIIASLAAGILDGLAIAPILGRDAFYGPHVLSALLGIALILPGLSVSVRRLHDIDRSGWWILIGLVPLIGNLVLLFWYVQPSQTGRNRFG